MAPSEHDQRVLRALGAAGEQHEQLADLLDFYSDLYTVQFEVKPELPAPEVRDELAMRWRLEGGIPQLTFDQLGLEEEPFARLVADLTSVLLRHNPTRKDETDDLEQEDLVALAQEVFETWDTLTGPSPSREPAGRSLAGSLTAMAVGFALAPYLQRASETILPHLDLALWKQGYCPVCGGRPNFSVLQEGSGARHLMCSRCASQWSFARIGCPFCDTVDRPTFFEGEDGLHRLYVCSACKSYLKAVDLRKARRVVNPMVERLLTVGMDLAAQQEGYSA
jgi:FdhE protein